MYNKYMEEYKRLYSEYVKQLVIVHNYHNIFVKRIGHESGKKVRVALTAMARLEREMKKACRQAYLENNILLKEQRKKTYTGFTLPEKRGPGGPSHSRRKNVDIPKSDSGGTS